MGDFTSDLAGLIRSFSTVKIEFPSCKTVIRFA